VFPPEVLVEIEEGKFGGEEVSREGDVGGIVLPPEELVRMTVGSVMLCLLFVDSMAFHE